MQPISDEFVERLLEVNGLLSAFLSASQALADQAMAEGQHDLTKGIRKTISNLELIYQANESIIHESGLCTDHVAVMQWRVPKNMNLTRMRGVVLRALGIDILRQAQEIKARGAETDDEFTFAGYGEMANLQDTVGEAWSNEMRAAQERNDEADSGQIQALKDLFGLS